MIPRRYDRRRGLARRAAAQLLAPAILAAMLVAGARYYALDPARAQAGIPPSSTASGSVALDARGSGRLVGTVTDLATGEPIAGAQVRAGDALGLTDARGTYRISLPPGHYRVRVTAPGFHGATAIDHELDPLRADGASRLDIALPPVAADAAAAAAIAAAVRARADSPPSTGTEDGVDQDQDPEQDPPLSAASEDPPALSLLAAAVITDTPRSVRVLMPDGRIMAMDMDEYLKGVVPTEMGYVFRRAFSALQAQAIASRTYAATRCLPETAGDPTRCERGLDANVDTTTRTQVWRPVHYDISDAAVESTSGQVVRGIDGTSAPGLGLVEALFFARAAERTLDSEESPCCGGRQVGHLRSVASPDPFARRWGHGAGMSQEGAAVLADWGATAAEIVDHYYTGARVRLPESPRLSEAGVGVNTAGDGDAVHTFTVRYQDGDGDPPSVAELVLDGQAQPMLLAAEEDDGRTDHRLGSTWRFTSTLEAGFHAFAFRFSDGFTPVVTVEGGEVDVAAQSESEGRSDETAEDAPEDVTEDVADGADEGAANDERGLDEPSGPDSGASTPDGPAVAGATADEDRSGDRTEDRPTSDADGASSAGPSAEIAGRAARPSDPGPGFGPGPARGPTPAPVQSGSHELDLTAPAATEDDEPEIAALAAAADGDTGPNLVFEGPVVEADFPFMALAVRWLEEPAPQTDDDASEGERDATPAPASDEAEGVEDADDNAASTNASADGIDEAVDATPLAVRPDGAGLRLEARVSRDGDIWSAWEELVTDDDGLRRGPEAEHWTRLWIARGRFAQVRVIALSDDAPRIGALTIHYLDADEGPRAPRIAASASRAPTGTGRGAGGVGALSVAGEVTAAGEDDGPPVITRAAWGADESLRLDDDGDVVWPPRYTQPRALIVHHTVTSNDPVDPAAVVRSIYHFHAITRGWGDIGYNVLIDDRGNIYEGRFGGERGDLVVQGGHARQYNPNTIGVAMLGTFTAAEQEPRATAYGSLVELLARRAVRYDIDPQATVELAGTRFAHRIMGHRDALPGHTVCPGEGLHAQLSGLRTGVVARMAELRAGSPDPRPTAPPTATPRPTATAGPTPTALPVGCRDLVTDGGFEDGDDQAWRLNRAFFTRWDVRSGVQAMFVGLRDADPDDVRSFASASQSVAVPSGVSRAQLRFQAKTAGQSSDTRMVRVFDADGKVVGLGGVALPANSAWTTHAFDVTDILQARGGEALTLYFGVINDGDGRKSYLRVDEVSLEACTPLREPPAGTETPDTEPTATPDPSGYPPPRTPDAVPTPRPTSTVGSGERPLACVAALEGGGFEASELGAWRVVGDQPAVRIDEPNHGGAAALQLGLLEAAEDGFGYAGARRTMRLPREVVSGTLSLWMQPRSIAEGDVFVAEIRRETDGARHVLYAGPPPGRPGLWSRLALPIDEAILAAFGLDAPNAPTAAHDVTLYLAVLNRDEVGARGDVTALVLDDVTFDVCGRARDEIYLPRTLLQAAEAETP